MGNDCETGKHKNTDLCENNCGQFVCNICKVKFGKMQLCTDCKPIIGQFAWGREAEEIKSLDERIKFGPSSEDQEIAKEILQTIKKMSHTTK